MYDGDHGRARRQLPKGRGSCALAVVDSKLDRRFRNPLRYYVEWFGYEGTDEQYSWVSPDDIDADDLIEAFHAQHPDKPGPGPPP